MPLPKYAIECQKCHDSLTIIYTAKENEDETSARNHVGKLMKLHLKLNKETPIPSLPELAKSAQKVRPAP